MRNLARAAFAVLALSLVSAVASASANWQVTQLTSGPYNDAYPQISGGNVIWQRQRETSMYTYPQICYYDGVQIRQLTDNWSVSEPQVGVSISGSRAAWDRIDSSGISYFDGTTVTRLSAPGGYYRDMFPSISETNVTWTAELGDTHDVFLFSDGLVRKLSNGGWNVASSISGNNVVWYGRAAGESYTQIYLYDGSTVTQLTHSSFSNTNPQIAGSSIAWVGLQSSGADLFLYDGTSIGQLAHSDMYIGGIQIDASNIVWQAWDGADYEIFLFRDGRVTQLTNNNYNDYSPDISGSYVTWEGRIGGKGEIFAYDGVSTTRLTSNSYDDYGPRIDANTVVWAGGTAEGYRIFTATLVPEPSVLLLLALGALAMLRRRGSTQC